MIAEKPMIEISCPECGNTTKVNNNLENHQGTCWCKCGEKLFWWAKYLWEEDYYTGTDMISGVEYKARLLNTKDINPALVKWTWILVSIAMLLGLLLWLITRQQGKAAMFI